MTVICRVCGQEWPRDPILEVVCPTCQAGIGSPCMRPSGHNVWGKDFHASRDILAMQTITGYGICPSISTPIAEKQPPSLFDTDVAPEAQP